MPWVLLGPGGPPLLGVFLGRARVLLCPGYVTLLRLARLTQPLPNQPPRTGAPRSPGAASSGLWHRHFRLWLSSSPARRGVAREKMGSCHLATREAGVRHAWGPGAPPGRGKAAQASSCRLVSEGPSRTGGRPRVHRGPQGACSSRGAHSHWQDRGTRASPLPSRRAAWPTDYIVSRPCVCVMRTTDTEKH